MPALIFIFLLFFLPTLDTDLWWHLRYGDYFWTTGQVLRDNILTYFLPNYQWAHSYTLYQLFVFLVYKFTQLAGLSFIYGLIMALAFRISRLPILLFIIVTIAGWDVLGLGLRAQIFTFLGLIITFRLLKNPLLLIPIFPFWANFHGGLILGIFILVFKSLDLLWQKDWRLAARMLFVIIISLLLIVIFNPFGKKIFEEIWRHSYYPLNTLIAEWVAPSVIWQILITAALGFSLFLLAIAKYPMKIFWFLTLIFFGYLSLTARRNLPLFFLTEAFFLAPFIKFPLKWQKIINMATVLSIFPFLFFRLYTIVPQECPHGLVAYPCPAINFLQNHSLPITNIFTSYEWSGFLEWRLPQYKFFADGRMPAWSTLDNKSPYTSYLEIIQAQPGYQDVLKKDGVEALILPIGTFLDLELQTKKNLYWKEIYRDSSAAIYQKTQEN